MTNQKIQAWAPRLLFATASIGIVAYHLLTAETASALTLERWAGAAFLTQLAFMAFPKVRGSDLLRVGIILFGLLEFARAVVGGVEPLQAWFFESSAVIAAGVVCVVVRAWTYASRLSRMSPGQVVYRRSRAGIETLILKLLCQHVFSLKLRRAEMV